MRRWIMLLILGTVAFGVTTLSGPPSQPPGNCGRNQVICEFGGCPDPQCGPCEFVWEHPCKPWIKRCRRIPGGCNAGMTELAPR